MDPFALISTLGVGQSRMEKSHSLAETRAESSRSLRSERDLRDEDDRGAPTLKRLSGGAKVDLGLPTTGLTKKEVILPAGVQCGSDSLDGNLLLTREAFGWWFAPEIGGSLATASTRTTSPAIAARRSWCRAAR